MDPRDRLRPLLDGVGCTVCGTIVPEDRIRILAHRDDLAFVELTCPGCRSETLGLLIAPDEADGRALLDIPAGPPISSADVAAMHDFLSGWDGDLRDLLGDAGYDVSDPSAGPLG
jgi:hypothetical protein